MTFLWAAVKIWSRIVLFNALIMVIGLIFVHTLNNGFLLVFLIIAAFLSAPFVITIITQTLRLSARIPYNLNAKKAWLAFMLSIIAFLFYAIAGSCLNEPFPLNEHDFGFYYSVTILSIVFTVILSKKSIQILNE